MAQASEPGAGAPGGDPRREGQESYERRAETRALAKLEDIRAGRIQDPEVGRSRVDVFAPLVVGGIIVLPLLLLSIVAVVDAFGTGRDVGGAAIFLSVMLSLAGAIVWWVVAAWRASAPTTPERALQAFYRALGQGKYPRAAALVLGADFDDFPRYQPQIPNLGQPSGRIFPFSAPDAFGTYWNELLRSHSWPYCYAKVRRVKVSEVSPNVAVADFNLSLAMNTQLYFLLVLASPIIAIIVDLATRKRVTLDTRKILVRVGGEWHLWSGDWQGWDEFDVNWLPPATSESTPYRGADFPDAR